MMRLTPLIALLCVFAIGGAHANEAAANKCAGTLPPTARIVFDAVAARPQPEFTLRAVLEARVRELVFMDRLMRSAARPAAEAASECLRIARDCVGDQC
jgi:hypothetical protein